MLPSHGEDYDFFASVRFRDKLMGFSIIGLPIIATIIFLIFYVKPEPIERHYVFGCFDSPNAPRMIITNSLISFDQYGAKPSTYSIVSEKQGYSIKVDANAALADEFGGTFKIVEAPYPLRFAMLPPHYDDPLRLRHVRDFSGRLTIYSRDGDLIEYMRINPKGSCWDQ